MSCLILFLTPLCSFGGAPFAAPPLDAPPPPPPAPPCCCCCCCCCCCAATCALTAAASPSPSSDAASSSSSCGQWREEYCCLWREKSLGVKEEEPCCLWREETCREERGPCWRVLGACDAADAPDAALCNGSQGRLHKCGDSSACSQSGMSADRYTQGPAVSPLSGAPCGARTRSPRGGGSQRGRRGGCNERGGRRRRGGGG